MPDRTPAESEAVVPAVIREANAAAHAARAWADALPPAPDPLPPAPDPQKPQKRPLPANAWCTRPATADERAAAGLRAGREHQAQRDPVERELDKLASHLVGTAYYANRDMVPELGMLPVAKPNLSAEAAERAHGCRVGTVRIWKYFSKRAYVCLDCHWVGAYVLAKSDGELPDAAAAAAHTCPRARQ